jgi:hypothetical protein
MRECGIVPQLTPAGMPQCNGVSERHNRTLLDMVRSMIDKGIDNRARQLSTPEAR